MTLPISKGHLEALEGSNNQIKLLVSRPVTTDSLNYFMSDYDGPSIDARALFPVFNALETSFAEFNKTYNLEEFGCKAFLASEDDAATIACYLNFFSFISLKLVDKSQYSLFTWFIGVYPPKYFFAANTCIAIAALALVNLNGDSYEYLDDSKEQQYYSICTGFQLYGYVPMYPNSDGILSNYSAYLDPCQAQPPTESISIGSFNLEMSEVCAHSTLEIIEMGMRVLPQDMWIELIYLARKTAINRDYNLEERQELVGLHAFQLLQFERMCATSGFLVQSNYTIPPYIDIFNSHLLQQFPKLAEYVVNIINHFRVTNFANQRIHARIQSEEMFLLALKCNNADLLDAIVTFYQNSGPNWKTITPMGAFMVIQTLERLNRDHSHLPVQISILKTLKQIIIGKDMSFAPVDEYISIIQSLVGMVQHQLVFDSRQDTEICKGLLVIVLMLLENDSSGALTLANDSTTLTILAACVRSNDLQLPAIGCLCAILGENMLSYTAVENSGLWETFLDLSNPFAQVKLHACLANTDKGKKIISTFNLKERFIDTVFDYSFNDQCFSQEYYSCVADAIVNSDGTLEQFGSRIPGYIRRVLKTLDDGPDESHFITTEDIWKQYSHSQNVVDHTILLLSSVVHRDQVRKQLEEPETFNLLLAILSHEHLPYGFVSQVESEQYKHLLNELFLGDNSHKMAQLLLKGLVDTLQSNMSSVPVLQKMQLYFNTLKLLQIKRGENFTKDIVKTILSDCNFQQSCTLIPKTLASLLGSQYDHTTGPEKNIVSCFLFGAHSGFDYDEQTKLFQIQQLQSINRLGISFEEYNAIKSKVLPVVFTRFSIQRFIRLLEELFCSCARSRIPLSPGFSQANYVLAIVKTLNSLQMINTRDRYIFVESKFVTRLDRIWLLPYFVLHDGFHALMDLWVNLHSIPASGDKITHQCFYSTNHFETAKQQLEYSFHTLGNYSGSWNTIAVVDPEFSEEALFSKCMNLRKYIIEQIATYHPPISSCFRGCWWQDDRDPISHLSQREYMLDNISSMFENQDCNGIRHGIYIVMEIIKTFEYQKPILDELIPELFRKHDLSAIALLSGIYTDPGIRCKVLTPKCDQLQPVFDALFIKDQEDRIILCACQLLAVIPVNTLSELNKEGRFTSNLTVLIEQTSNTKTIMNILQLATLCNTIRLPTVHNPKSILETVSASCMKVFEEARFDLDSIMAYSILADFNRTIIENDPSVLEMFMGYMISSKCPADGIDTDLIGSELGGYSGRSEYCFKSAISRYFMTDADGQVLFPRSSLSAATGIPLVLDGQLPDISSDSKHIIDGTITGFVQQCSRFIEVTKKLMENHTTTKRFYLSHSDYMSSSERFAELDYISTSAWADYQKAFFSLKLHSDLLNYLTLSYGAPVEYIVGHCEFPDLLRAASTLATTISLQSGGHTEIPGYRNQQRDSLFVFITNLYSCAPKITRKTVLSLRELLSISDSRFDILDIAMGIIYIGTPKSQTADFLESISCSELLQMCAGILGLDKAPYRNMKYDATGFYTRYYHALTEDYRHRMETYRKVNKLENNLASGDTKAKTTSQAYHDPVENPIDDTGDDSSDASDDELLTDPAPDGDDVNSFRPSADNIGDSHQPENDVEELSDIMSYDSNAEDDSDYQDSPYYSEYDEDDDEPIRVGGPFDIGEFCYSAPNSPTYCSWGFSLSSNTTDFATQTLCNSYHAPEGNTSHIFYVETDYQYLTMRGINVAPIYAPEDPKYIPPSRMFSRRPVIPCFSVFGFESYDTSTGSNSCLKIILRTWEEFRSHKPINWSSVPKLSSDMAEECFIPTATSLDTTNPLNTGTKEITDGQKASDDNISYEVAVSKGIYLLEHPDELDSWGLDANSLQSLPEDMRLESIISYLAVYGASEMSDADIKATLDDETFYEASVLEIQNTDKPVPEYIKLSMTAQLCENQGFQTHLKSLIWKKMPFGPELSAGFLFQQGVLLGQVLYGSLEYFSAFVEIKDVENEVMRMFRDKLESSAPELYTKNLAPLLCYFKNINTGSLMVDLIIDIMDNQQILRIKSGFANILECLHKSVENGNVHKIGQSSMSRLLSVYLSALISSSHRRKLRKDILTMISKGFTTEFLLKESLCARILGQLDKCIQAIKQGNLSDNYFSGLESMLSALTTHPLCDFNEGSDEIVGRAVVLGSHVSGIISTSEDAASSIRLLRCYLLLVTLTPRARSAFVSFVTENQKFVNRVVSQDSSILKSCMANLNGHFYLFDYETKLGYIRTILPQKGYPSNKLVIHRAHLFSDSYKQVNALSSSDLLNKPFKIVFDAELGFDGGGLTKEWLTLLSRELPDTTYGLFNRITSGGNGFILHPNPQSLYDGSNVKLYEFIGKLMAKAVLLKQQFDCNFSRVIYCLIVSKKPNYYSLEELYLFDSELAKSLEWVLANDITNVLMETFTTKSNAFGDIQLMELKPGGRNIEVTEENKQEYVHLMIKHTLFTRVEKQIMAICAGFWSVIPYKLVKLLEASELQKLLSGSELDIDQWKSNTIYTGYTPSSLSVKYFWQAIKSMSDSEQRQVLFFATGTDKVSAFGFSGGANRTKFTIAQLYDGPIAAGMKLPTASTCSSLLHLPEYSSQEEALLSLKKAIELGGIGFGFG